MNEIMIVSRQLKGFPYQLTIGVKNLGELRKYLDPFIKYGDQYRMIVVSKKSGYSIFTDGKEVQKEAR